MKYRTSISQNNGMESPLLHQRNICMYTTHTNHSAMCTLCNYTFSVSQFAEEMRNMFSHIRKIFSNMICVAIFLISFGQRNECGAYSHGNKVNLF